MTPVRGRTSVAQLLQLLASAVTIVPFIGIVESGSYSRAARWTPAGSGRRWRWWSVACWCAPSPAASR
ncbi:MAG: hypothetical protein QOI25_2956 [Mycobacterium sp.]|nr:hypothetical protein [Mycobacterium sp.]